MARSFPTTISSQDDDFYCTMYNTAFSITSRPNSYLVSTFDASTVAVVNVMSDLMYFADISPSVFLATLVYIDRAVNNVTSLLVQCNDEIEIFTAAFMLANKWLEDEAYGARFFANVTGVSAQTICETEYRMLRSLNYSLSISSDEMRRAGHGVITAAMAGKEGISVMMKMFTVGIDGLVTGSPTALYQQPAQHYQIVSPQMTGNSIYNMPHVIQPQLCSQTVHQHSVMDLRDPPCREEHDQYVEAPCSGDEMYRMDAAASVDALISDHSNLNHNQNGEFKTDLCASAIYNAVHSNTHPTGICTGVLHAMGLDNAIADVGKIHPIFNSDGDTRLPSRAERMDAAELSMMERDLEDDLFSSLKEYHNDVINHNNLLSAASLVMPGRVSKVPNILDTMGIAFEPLPVCEGQAMQMM